MTNKTTNKDPNFNDKNFQGQTKKQIQKQTRNIKKKRKKGRDRKELESIKDYIKK